MSELTQARLKELLHYNPDTGTFTWKSTKNSQSPVGTSNRGYIRISIDNKLYYAHRLAWLYMEGFLHSSVVIDHRDRDKQNNSWDNIRMVSNMCNARNIGNCKHNTSGVKGVSWCNHLQKWHANMMISQKNISLGYYNDFENAVCARLAGEQCVEWSDCDSGSPAYKYVIGNIIKKENKE